MLKRFFLIYMVVWLMFLFFLARSVPAYYGDLATDKASVALGIAGQNGNQITSLTALSPLGNGWAGAYLSRQVAEGEVVSETYNGHLQGGFLVRGIGVEAYIEATRTSGVPSTLRLRWAISFVRGGSPGVPSPFRVARATTRNGGMWMRRSVATRMTRPPLSVGLLSSVVNGERCRALYGSSRVLTLRRHGWRAAFRSIRNCRKQWRWASPRRGFLIHSPLPRVMSIVLT